MLSGRWFEEGASPPHHLFFSLCRELLPRPMRGGWRPLCAPQCMGAPPHAPGDFLMRRKSPKTHQEPPGSWTSGTRGRTPLDSPAFCPSGIGCGGLNLQASSKPMHLPSHGLTAESVTPGKTRGEKKTDLPTQLKVANRSRFVVETLLGGCGNRRGSEASPSGDSKGRSPWRAFGDFPRDGKVTRGWRGGAPSPLRVEAKSGDLLRELCSHMGSAEGAQPPRKGVQGPPCKRKGNYCLTNRDFWGREGLLYNKNRRKEVRRQQQLVAAAAAAANIKRRLCDE